MAFPRAFLSQNTFAFQDFADFSKKAKATYISHDGYIRPCCYVHRHNKTERDEPWLLNDEHNIASGKSLSEMFSTLEYTDFFDRLKTGKDIPERCYEVCGKVQTNVGADHRKEKIVEDTPRWVETVNQTYDDSYKVLKHNARSVLDYARAKPAQSSSIYNLVRIKCIVNDM